MYAVTSSINPRCLITIRSGSSSRSVPSYPARQIVTDPSSGAARVVDEGDGPMLALTEKVGHAVNGTGEGG